MNNLPIKCYDNGGKTVDRYTVVFLNEPEHNGLYGARGMSENPYHPQGFGMYVSASLGRHLGKLIAFEDLPLKCQQLVNSDLRPN